LQFQKEKTSEITWVTALIYVSCDQDENAHLSNANFASKGAGQNVFSRPTEI
jgi:hypothetical protein